MKNILIYSDLHITQSSLKECALILEEIGMLANKYNCDTLINLGDTFDGLRPTSSEMDIFATFIRRLGNDKQHIILAADSHESETKEISILNHYGILANNVRIVKEYKDQNHLFCGHFILKESSKNFGAKLSKEDLKQYLYTFLGHSHSYEVIKPNCVQLGSSRWVNFGEANDKNKIIALITDYDAPQEQVHFLKLKSPIPMIQLELYQNTSKNSPLEAPESINLAQNASEGKDTNLIKSSILQGGNPPKPGEFRDVSQLSAFLDKTDQKTKIKVKIFDFESFKAFLPLESKYQKKFEKFVRENDFELISDDTTKRAKSEIDLKQSFEKFAKEKQIDEEIKEIINKEIKC
jgi:DNA repair exonuclease SbcCD nuclease subunit